MKFRLASDIHLEFGDFAFPSLPDDKDTVLLLAGDIAPIKRKSVYFEFITDAVNRFRKVVWIMGNHEYYGGSYDNAMTKLDGYLVEWLEDLEFDNYLHCINMETVDVGDDVVVVGATLWTDFDGQNPITMQKAKDYMNDYRVIRGGNDPNDYYKGTLRPEVTLREHLQAKVFIFEQCRKLKAEGKKVLVMTHHGPSRQSIHPQYKGDELNGAYVTELAYDIFDLDDQGLAPDLWVHGHVHNTFDYQIGSTRVLTNPRGYVNVGGRSRPENPQFDPELVIEL